ncbi:MAG: BMP family lipoprotein [Gaiellales bacterium]
MRVLTALVFAVLTVTVAAGCGSSSSSNNTTTQTGTGATTADHSNIKVGLVTDIGGLNDRSFNHLAFLGLQRAHTNLGVTVRVLQSNQNSDYVPNLQTLAAQHYNLVIAVGFLMGDAVKQVSAAYPNTTFAIIDFSYAPNNIKNVQGLLFKEQDAGYLAGYLAGLVTKTGTVSTVGGQKIPPVDHYIAGYQAGAKASHPGIKTLNAYSQSFTDTAKCQQLALDQISQGSDVVFQVAGGCGLGALNAAKQKNVWGVGVDADQGYLGSYILTSAEKKVDVAVYDTIKDLVDGKHIGGADSIFDAANGGTGIGKISPKVPKADVAKVMAVQKKLEAGQITPPDTVP